MIAVVLALAAAVSAWRIIILARGFNDELAILDPAAERSPPAIRDPRTSRISQRVVLVIVDGLRLDQSYLPAFDALRARGAGLTAAAHYPTWSRPGYIALLTGVPPEASGVRVNRVRQPIRLDSIMKRAVAAGMRVNTASDIGMVPPLFINEDIPELSGLDHPRTGDLVEPAAGMTWPFHEVRKADTLQELEKSVERVLATPSDLVIVLSGSVDRAGHARGGTSALYREAATTFDGALARLVPKLDLSRDTLIVTADHGHVDRGGHGGTEPDAIAVPLIAVGAGIVPGARAPTARLVDIAPTIAALLGIPAPGHGHGRSLVELLRLDRTAVDARLAADTERLAIARDVPPDPSGPNTLHLGIVGGALLFAILLAIVVRPAIRVPLGAWVGAIAWVYLLLAMVAACRAQLSPSEVPALWRLQRILAVVGAGGIAMQVVASWYVVRSRRGAQRLARANGIALVGLAVALVPTFALRGWFAVPHVEVPEPAWLVAIPAVELAAAVGCVAIVFHLVFELIASRRS